MYFISVKQLNLFAMLSLLTEFIIIHCMSNISPLIVWSSNRMNLNPWLGWQVEANVSWDWASSWSVHWYQSETDLTHSLWGCSVSRAAQYWVSIRYLNVFQRPWSLGPGLWHRTFEDISISFDHQFHSQQLHFLKSSLLMCLLGPCLPCGRLGVSPSFCMHLGAWSSRQKIPLWLFLSLSLRNSIFQAKEIIKKKNLRSQHEQNSEEQSFGLNKKLCSRECK